MQRLGPQYNDGETADEMLDRLIAAQAPPADAAIPVAQMMAQPYTPGYASEEKSGVH